MKLIDIRRIVFKHIPREGFVEMYEVWITVSKVTKQINNYQFVNAMAWLEKAAI